MSYLLYGIKKNCLIDFYKTENNEDPAGLIMYSKYTDWIC